MKNNTRYSNNMKHMIASVLALGQFIGCAPYHPDRALCSKDKPDFTFVQIADNHIGLGHESKTVRAIRVANELAPDFVVFSGDLANDTQNDTAEGRAEVDEFKSYASFLVPPAYYVPGNHDLGYTTTGYSNRQANKDLFENHIGPLNQVFTHKGFTFILLDDNYLEAGLRPMVLAAWQLAWIEDILKQGQPTIIIGHINAIQDGMPWGDGAKLVDLMNHYTNALGYIHGHVHGGSVDVINNKFYFGAPSVLGAIPGAGETGIDSGYVVEHRIYGVAVESCLIPLDGSTPYRGI